VSAHSASQRGGWLSALVAQVSDWIFEEAEETIEAPPMELKPHPVVAVVAAAPRAGASTVARLLAAELACRADGAAAVIASAARRRSAPPSRAAIRVATALTGVGATHPVGRLCVLDADAQPAGTARYLAPVVLDVPADGSAAGIAAVADRVIVVGSAAGEPALLDAVASVIGGDVIKVANRVTDPGDWPDRADALLPESRLGARAAALGTRAIGSLGSEVAALADALELGG
jgi:hypothetical protein